MVAAHWGRIITAIASSGLLLLSGLTWSDLVSSADAAAEVAERRRSAAWIETGCVRQVEAGTGSAKTSLGTRLTESGADDGKAKGWLAVVKYSWKRRWRAWIVAVGA
jgi:hypothetical protein